MAVCLATKLAKIFRGLIADGSNPILCRTANRTPITKEIKVPLLSYRYISITPVISKVYQKNNF